jgi:PKD domain
VHGLSIGAARYDAAPSLSAVSVPLGALVGQQLSFSASASEPVTLSWDFGDGATATGSPASQAYAAPGDYTVKVTAQDGAGNQVSETHVFSGLTLTRQRIVIRKGIGRVAAACSAATAGGCAGRLRLLEGKKVVAKASFDVRSGRTARIRFRLRHVPRSLRATATAHDALGATRTTSAKLKLLRK